MRKKISIFLLILIGISYPLINTRISLPFWSISLFILSLLIFIFFELVNKNFKFYKLLKFEYCIFIFMFFTLLSSLYSINLEYAVARIIKYIIIVFIYFLLSRILVKYNGKINSLLKLSSFSVTIFLIYLIYIYIFVFGENYIGVIVSYSTEENKNALAYVLTALLPFTISFFIFEKNKLITKFFYRLTLLIIIVGIFLLQSRSLYVVSFTYIIIIFITKKLKFSSILKVIFYVIAFMILGSLFLPNEMINFISLRINSISLLFTSNNSYLYYGSGYYSLITRQELISKGINIFINNPIFGIGLGAFMDYGNLTQISHNDFISVLSEQGLVGFIPYLIFVLYFIRLSFINFKNKKTLLNYGALLSVIGLTINMLTNNTYDSIYLWFTYSIITSTYIYQNKVVYNEK